jgi:hypothetical protein
MNAQLPRCRICQCEKRNGERWFLVTENNWEDRVKILPWSEKLARGRGAHGACSPSHVQQLVAHWMATGSLDYPFARHACKSAQASFLEENALEGDLAPALEKSRPLGELAVDRESLKQVLIENPESLVPVLDALVTALDEVAIADEKSVFPIPQEPNRNQFSFISHRQCLTEAACERRR